MYLLDFTSYPSDLFFQFGAEQQIREEEDVSQLPGSFHQLYHEAVPQQLPVLWRKTHKHNVPGQEHWGPGVNITTAEEKKRNIQIKVKH